MQGGKQRGTSYLQESLEKGRKFQQYTICVEVDSHDRESKFICKQLIIVNITMFYWLGVRTTEMPTKAVSRSQQKGSFFQ